MNPAELLEAVVAGLSQGQVPPGGVDMRARLAEIENTLVSGRELRFLQEFMVFSMDKTPYGVFFGATAIKKILERYGSCTDPAILDGMLNAMVDLAGRNAALIVTNDYVTNSVIEVISIIGRFAFEIAPPNFNSVFESIGRMLAMDTLEHKVIALRLMRFLCNHFKDSVEHLDSTENANVKRAFAGNLLQFFDTGANIIAGEFHPGLFKEALKMMESVLNYFNTNMDHDKPIPFPAEFSKYFENDRLIHLVLDKFICPDVSEDTLKVMIPIASARSVWPSADTLGQFMVCLMEKVTQCIGALGPGIGEPRLLARLVTVIAQQMYMVPPVLGHPSFPGFLAAVEALSNMVFGIVADNEDAVKMMFQFWTELSGLVQKGGLPEEVASAFYEILARIFSSFVTSTLQRTAEDPAAWIENVEALSPQLFEMLWQFLGKIIRHGYTSLVTIIGQVMETSGPAQISSLVFLVRIATAALSRGKTASLYTREEDHEASMQLFITVCNVIGATTPVLGQLIEAMGESEAILETCLIEFMDKTHGLIQWQADEKNLKIMFDLLSTFMNRISAILASPVTRPGQIVRTLDILEKMLLRKDQIIMKMESETPDMISQLLGFSLTINMEHLDIIDTKKPRVHLGRVYMTLVRNSEMMSAILGTYDEKIKAIGNDADAFRVFVELKGLFKGVGNNSDHYRTLLDWFAGNHMETTANAIRQFSENYHVLKAVSELWISAFPDRLPNNKSFRNSGFGISLFKASLEVVKMLAGTASDMDKVRLLLKVMKYCLSTECANFGVMEFYGDQSYMEMVSLFIEVVNKTMNETMMQTAKTVKNVLDSIKAIVNVRGTRIFEGDLIGELAKIIGYCFKMCGISNDTELIWNAAFDAMEPILDMIGANAEVHGAIKMFEPHIAIILGTMLRNGYKYVTRSLYVMLYAAALMPDVVRGQVGEVMTTIDPVFHKNIEEAFTALVSGCEVPITEAMKKEFKDQRIFAFKTRMRMYRMPVENSAYFANFM